MKMFQLLSTAGIGLFLFTGVAQAQDEYPKPGPDHQRLKQMAGEWNAEIKVVVEPGKAPQESKGEFSAKMDLGGFFLVTQFKGELAGAPFQGRGITGYDPFKKKYTGVWVDSMNPGLYHTHGAFDKSGKVFNEVMDGPDPKGKPTKFRAVTRIISPDRMSFHIYMRGEDGKEMQIMEVAYTRKK